MPYPEAEIDVLKEQEKLAKEQIKETKKESTVAGITGFAGRAAGSSVVKQAGKYGWLIGLIMLLAVILFCLGTFVGGIFSIIPLYWQMILLGGLLFIGLLFKGKTGAAVMVLIFFIALGGIAGYLQYTQYGQSVAIHAQVQGVGAIQGFKALTGPLNVMNQIFTGTYNPENLWRSDTVESQYETVTDVGVVLDNVAPLRDKFYSDQPIVVQGRIDAVAFPGQTASASLTAKCTSESIVPGVKECKNPTSWTCQPQFTNIKQIRNRFFSCTHDPIEEGVYAVDITATAQNTVTVAGKQFVFANPDVAITLNDPLQTWGISKDSLKSWQKGDQSVNLGIGVEGVDEYGYLEAGSNIPYYLGIRIENPSSSGTVDLNTVNLFVPKALFSNNCATAANSDFKSCKDASADDLKNFGIKTSASLCSCAAGFASESLAPSDYRHALLKLNIDKSQLYGADFGTFFILATAKYNYKNSELVAVTVENKIGTGGVTT